MHVRSWPWAHVIARHRPSDRRSDYKLQFSNYTVQYARTGNDISLHESAEAHSSSVLIALRLNWSLFTSILRTHSNRLPANPAYHYQLFVWMVCFDSNRTRASIGTRARRPATQRTLSSKTNYKRSENRYKCSEYRNLKKLFVAFYRVRVCHGNAQTAQHSDGAQMCQIDERMLSHDTISIARLINKYVYSKLDTMESKRSDK